MQYEFKHVGGPKWAAVDENGETVREFKGKRADAEAEFEEFVAGLGDVEASDESVDVQKASTEEREVPKLNPDGLTGLAKTAALNEQVDTVFVESEYKLASGIHNEANKVYNVPDGWQAAWATPRHIDQGRHANYLRERGYRPVYRDEMGTDMYEDEIYVAYVDDSDSEYVFMNGAQLFIGPSERLAKLRQTEYDNHMAALNSKQEEDRELAEDLGGHLKTQRDSSTYNPMRN